MEATIFYVVTGSNTSYFLDSMSVLVSIDFTDVLCSADKINDVLVKYAERLIPHLPSQVCFSFNCFSGIRMYKVTKLHENMSHKYNFEKRTSFLHLLHTEAAIDSYRNTGSLRCVGNCFFSEVNN